MSFHFAFLSFIEILDINDVTHIACIKPQTTFFILDITDIKLQIIQILHVRHKKDVFLEYKEYLWQRMQY